MYDILGCSFVALLLYWNTLDADFAYDDSRAILKNQDILQTTPLSNIFYNDFWGTPLVHSGSHKSYRPLCVLSYRLNHLLGQLDPYGYHLGNVLLHVAVTGLFTYAARALLLRRTLPACLAGLLFAAHPIHTEAVAGIVGRADVGACLLFLLSFISYVRYCQARDARLADWTRGSDGGTTRALWECALLGLSILLATMSMLTKEQGMMVLAVNAAYDIFIQNKMRLRDFLSLRFLSQDYGRLREGVMSQIVSVVVLVGLRLHFMGNTPPQFAPSDNPAASEGSLQTRLLTFLHLPALNAWLLLCPHRLSFDWSMGAVPLVQSPADPRNLTTAAFYSALAAFAWYCFRELDDLHRGDEEHRQPATSHHGNGHCKSNGLTNGHCKSNGYSNGHKSLPNGHGKNGFVKNGYAYHASSASNGMRHDSQTHLHKRSASHKKGQPPLVVDASPALSGEDLARERTRILNAVIASFALLVLPFLPATNVAFYVGFVVAERILYIPSMGFCLLAGEAVHQLWRRSCGGRRAAVGAAAVALLVLFGARTFLRNFDWHSEEALYRSGIDVNPPKAWGNLANILKAQGKTAEAEEAYKNALSYRGNMADVHYNLGILLQESKRFEEAVTSYQMAIQCRPRLANAHLNLGIVLNLLGRRAEAEAVYRHAATLDDTGLKDPKNQMTGIISSLFNLGRLLQDQGRYEEALKAFMEGIGRRPDHYAPQSLYNMLGETYFQLGRQESAERWFKKSLEAKPDHVPAHLTYAHMLSKTGRLAEAENFLRKAAELDWTNYNVYQHYGQFLNDQGRPQEALAMLRRAYDLQPDEHEVTFNLANALRQVGSNQEAEGFYKKAAELKPLVATSHMNLGAIYHLNGKLEEAELSYTEALRLQPQDPTTLQNLRKLRSLMAKRTRAAQTKSKEG